VNGTGNGAAATPGNVQGPSPESAKAANRRDASSADADAGHGTGAPQAGVSCRRLSRTFGSTRALDRVDLDVAAGTIHALVGQNGAGKSTCLGIIAGRIRPTAGDVTVLGKPFHYGNPRSAQDAGVAAVYQELTVIPQLSPQANVFLANPVTRNGCLRRETMRKRYEQLCDDLGIPAAPDVPVSHLTVAQQQLIEIARAVVSRSKVLLLDEPTTALPLEERQALFRVLRSLRASGTTIMLVSHNLEEVLANCDVVTVFRDGRLVATRPAAEWTRKDLIQHMLGDSSRELLQVETTGKKAPGAGDVTITAADRPVRLHARNIRLPGRLHDVSIELRAGEVLGLAGLMGSGRSSLLRALSGAERGTKGSLEVDGRPRPWPSTPRAAQALGIAFLPEDRKTEGVCLGMTSADNVVLARLRTVSRLGYLSPRQVAARARPYLQAVGVDLGKARHSARSLSGGNQQKLLFARMSYIQPRILLADEPTRGVDVGAKTDILEDVRRLAHQDGVAVILVSSELEEVIAFSDRILVMAAGRIVGEFAGSDVTESQILSHAFRVDEVRA
jgi:ABC-type sugar transport system ATPase subunit